MKPTFDNCLPLLLEVPKPLNTIFSVSIMVLNYYCTYDRQLRNGQFDASRHHRLSFNHLPNAFLNNFPFSPVNSPLRGQADFRKVSIFLELNQSFNKGV